MPPTIAIITDFNPLHPRRRRPSSTIWGYLRDIFQSTPPAKAETNMAEKWRGWYKFQSTPPAKAETRLCFLGFVKSTISIHSTREGGDGKNHPVYVQSIIFQSTPPAKAETLMLPGNCVPSAISIHSTREGGDLISGQNFLIMVNFNPLHPRRRRQGTVIHDGFHGDFNPLHPRRRRRD